MKTKTNQIVAFSPRIFGQKNSDKIEFLTNLFIKKINNAIKIGSMSSSSGIIKVNLPFIDDSIVYNKIRKNLIDCYIKQGWGKVDIIQNESYYKGRIPKLRISLYTETAKNEENELDIAINGLFSRN